MKRLGNAGKLKKLHIGMTSRGVIVRGVPDGIVGTRYPAKVKSTRPSAKALAGNNPRQVTSRPSLQSADLGGGPAGKTTIHSPAPSGTKEGDPRQSSLVPNNHGRIASSVLKVITGNQHG
jgi:hypothetical protein